MNTPAKQPRPSWERMEAMLREWHEDSLTDPEFMWLAVSFEDMADHVSRAIEGAKQPHYLDKQDRRRHPECAELGVGA